MSDFTEKLSEKLINAKAEKNNTIDLNAYGIGVEDGIKHSRAEEMREMLEKVRYLILEGETHDKHHIISEIYYLLKESTEI